MNKADVLYVERKAGFLWVTLPKEISMHNHQEIENTIEAAITEKTNHVVLDFSSITTIFSSGLGLLIRLRRSAQAKGGSVCLVNVVRQLRDLMLAMNLDRVFPIYATDIEFEISQHELWESKSAEQKLGFLFLPRVENGACRINISGEMIDKNDISACEEFSLPDNIDTFVFDLSNLESIDENGFSTLEQLFEKIRTQGGSCKIYGASEVIQHALMLMGVVGEPEMFGDECTALS